jgi:predicted nucleic acid-binding protein
MGLIEKLTNKAVFLDSAPLIYFMEENHTYISLLRNLFTANNNGAFIFKTSVVTLMEVLVHPMRHNEQTLAEQYQEILCNSSSIDIINIDIEVAVKTAWLRAKYALKTPDAIQLATALISLSDFFLTNDVRLKNIEEIEVLTLDDYNA